MCTDKLEHGIEHLNLRIELKRYDENSEDKVLSISSLNTQVTTNDIALGVAHQVVWSKYVVSRRRYVVDGPQNSVL